MLEFITYNSPKKTPYLEIAEEKNQLCISFQELLCADQKGFVMCSRPTSCNECVLDDCQFPESHVKNLHVNVWYVWLEKKNLNANECDNRSGVTYMK